MNPTNETSFLSAVVPTVDGLHATWSSSPEARPFAGQEPISLAVLDRLGDGQPADAACLAEQTGLETAEIQQRLQAAAASGWEIEDGAIVNAALTLNPTAHQFAVRGHQLYTWCGFDVPADPAGRDRRHPLHLPGHRPDRRRRRHRPGRLADNHGRRDRGLAGHRVFSHGGT